MGRTKIYFTSKKKKKKKKDKDTESDTESESDEDKVDIKVNHNHIYFWCDVTKKSSLDLTIKLRNAYSKISQLTMPEDDKIPLYLHINSYGGEVDAALGVVDTMESLKRSGARIITIVEGYAASAATLISVSGSERRMMTHSYLRIHGMSASVWGKKSELDDEHCNFGKVEDILINIYKNKTELNTREIKKLMSREIDLLPKDCIKKGIVDKIQL